MVKLSELFLPNNYPEVLKKLTEEGRYITQTQHVFNVDETELCWKCMPDRTFNSTIKMMMQYQRLITSQSSSRPSNKGGIPQLSSSWVGVGPMVCYITMHLTAMQLSEPFSYFEVGL